MLTLVSPATGEPLTAGGAALVSASGERFPVVRGIPRFVPADNYTNAFGLQWTQHVQTQLDSHVGKPISATRLERCLGFPLAELRGKSVLEAGCGAGRFTELLVRAGALTHSIDMSIAVEANQDNIGAAANYVVAQADLTRPPFPQAAFDVVLCLGVLQHTPSPEASVRALWGMVKPGGLLVIDHYAWSLAMVTKLTWYYRPLFKRLPPKLAKRLTDAMCSLFFPLHWSVRRIRPAQVLLSRVSPCLTYFRKHPELDKAQHAELCRLDTYDNLTDYYKHLRTRRQIAALLESLHGEEIRAARGGNGIEARARKPSA